MHNDVAEYMQRLEAENAELKEQLKRGRVAVIEMYNDWQKGDFELPKLAQLDLKGIMSAIAALEDK